MTDFGQDPAQVAPPPAPDPAPAPAPAPAAPAAEPTLADVMAAVTALQAENAALKAEYERFQAIPEVAALVADLGPSQDRMSGFSHAEARVREWVRDEIEQAKNEVAAAA